MGRVISWLMLVSVTTAASAAAGQAKPTVQPSTRSAQNSADAAAVPPDYVIGPEDVLTVVFWREQDLSGDLVVRPDGKISLPLLNDIQAAGLTPDQLRQKLAEAADKYVQTPTPTVVVKTINSRRAFVTGMVQKPGSYSLIGPTTVLHLIAAAGGLQEFADAKNIVIIRQEGKRQTSLRFNYNEVSKRKKLEQNVLLKPGDTVIVP